MGSPLDWNERIVAALARDVAGLDQPFEQLDDFPPEQLAREFVDHVLTTTKGTPDDWYGAVLTLINTMRAEAEYNADLERENRMYDNWDA